MGRGRTKKKAVMTPLASARLFPSTPNTSGKGATSFKTPNETQLETIVEEPHLKIVKEEKEDTPTPKL